MKNLFKFIFISVALIVNGCGKSDLSQSNQENKSNDLTKFVNP